MRETEFIKQNKDKWQEFEKTLLSSKSDPEALARVFVETTDDLSYARTHYRNRSVRVYLNSLSQRIYQLIYKNRRGTKNFGFWTYEMPLSMYRSMPELILAFIVFGLAIFIGVFSSQYHQDFLAIIVGDEYVQMTESNIESGDPMGVYKSMDQLPMFLMIAWNNLRVSYLVFVLGVFFSVGTIMALIHNGVMVGAFVYFFIERGFGTESTITIMMHGTIELSCIVLAGTAGIALGKGLVIPGTYTRMQAFLMSSRKAIIMMLGITPFIVLAALIEGFVTRMTDVHNFIRVGIILASFFMMVWYFVILPIRLFRKKQPELLTGEKEVRTINEHVVEFYTLKSGGQLLAESFSFLRNHIKSALRMSIIGGVLACIIFGAHNAFHYSEIESDFFIQYYNVIEQIINYFWWIDDVDTFLNYDLYPGMLVFNTLIFSLIFLSTAYRLRQKWENYSFLKYLNLHWWKVLILMTAINITMLSIPILAFVIVFFVLFPIAFMVMGNIISGNSSLAKEAWKHQFLSIFGGMFVMLLLQFMMMVLVNTPISFLIFDFLLQNLESSGRIASEAPFLLYTLLCMVAIYLLSFLNFYMLGLMFGSSVEASNAQSLRRRVSMIRKKTNAYGIERE